MADRANVAGPIIWHVVGIVKVSTSGWAVDPLDASRWWAQHL